MNLTQVRLARIARHARAMLDRRARVRVALDAEAGEEANARAVRLRQRVGGARAHRGHRSVHRSHSFPFTAAATEPGGNGSTRRHRGSFGPWQRRSLSTNRERQLVLGVVYSSKGGR